MLRKILIGFCLIVMLAFGGLAVFIQTFDLNRYLPQLTEQASKILGRKVTVERAGFNLSLARGIVADIAAILPKYALSVAPKGILIMRALSRRQNLMPRPNRKRTKTLLPRCPCCWSIRLKYLTAILQ